MVHSLEIGRKMRVMAELVKPDDSDYSESLFMFGFLHDIGYEFVGFENHASIGGLLLKQQGFKYWLEVCNHGKVEIDYASKELEMLNVADLLTRMVLLINFQQLGTN